MEYLIWIVAAFGFIALIGVFVRMTPGFGPYTTRALGIVLVGTFVTLLGIKDTNALIAAIGILGAIAGYVFGIKKDD